MQSVCCLDGHFSRSGLRPSSSAPLYPARRQDPALPPPPHPPTPPTHTHTIHTHPFFRWLSSREGTIRDNYFYTVTPRPGTCPQGLCGSVCVCLSVCLRECVCERESVCACVCARARALVLLKSAGETDHTIPPQS